MRKLISLILCLVCTTDFISASIVPVAPSYAMPEANAVSENSIRLLSYNIRVDHEFDRLTENKWEQRAEKVLYVLKKYSGDIITLQEPNVEQLEDVKKAFDHNFTWIYGKASDRAYEDYEAFKNDAQHLETQVIGFNHKRFSLIDSGRFWLAEDPSKEPIKPAWDGSVWSRVAVYALLEERSTGKRIGVFTTHFDHVGLNARINSFKLIVQKAIGLTKGVPFIITGDFNTFQNGL